MKMYAYDYCDRTDGYELWYSTMKQKSKKFRWFATLDEAKKWLRSRRDKINIISGSWQLFDLYKQYKFERKFKEENIMPVAISTKYYCDCCGNEIPTKKKIDCFGVDHTIIKTGRINCKPFYNNFDMMQFGIYYCELCAEKINHRLDVMKLNTLLQEK